MCELREAMQELVAACAYVKPFAGAVAVEPKVKNIREAARFMEAVERAKQALSAYLNALHEEGTRDDLLREVGRLYDENVQLRAEVKQLRRELDMIQCPIQE